MEASQTDSLNSDDSAARPEKEPLADYVKRMETEENLRKLAEKLKEEFRKPDVSTRTPDLSFEKFEERRKRGEGQ